MAERFLLERETREIALEGRVFRLEEMSGSDLRRYLELVSGPVEATVKELAEHGEARIPEALAALQAADNEMLIWLLRHPADGGAPADGEFVSALSFRQRRRLIELQDDLNDTEAIVGNGRNLLVMARARRVASTVLDGPN